MKQKKEKPKKKIKADREKERSFDKDWADFSASKMKIKPATSKTEENNCQYRKSKTLFRREWTFRQAKMDRSPEYIYIQIAGYFIVQQKLT